MPGGAAGSGPSRPEAPPRLQPPRPHQTRNARRMPLFRPTCSDVPELHAPLLVLAQHMPPICEHAGMPQWRQARDAHRRPLLLRRGRRRACRGRRRQEAVRTASCAVRGFRVLLN